MYGNSKQRQTHRELNMHNLNWMDGGDGEGGGLFVFMMKFVEMLVQPGCVVQPVKYIGCVILKC